MCMTIPSALVPAALEEDQPDDADDGADDHDHREALPRGGHDELVARVARGLHDAAVEVLHVLVSLLLGYCADG